MPSKVDKKLTALVGKFFSPTASLFDKQEALIGFMAYLRFPSDRILSELVFILYDVQYKSSFLAKNGIDVALRHGLDINKFYKDVNEITYFPYIRHDFGLYNREDFHLKSLMCAEIVEFLIAYWSKSGNKPSIKKSHYYFKRYKSYYSKFNYNIAWRLFNKNWVSYKNVSFFLLSNIYEDDFMNFSLLEEDALDVIDQILADPDRFVRFLRKSRYIYDELKRVLDRRATATFSFPALPAGFTPMAPELRPMNEDEARYMRGYKTPKNS